MTSHQILVRDSGRNVLAAVEYSNASFTLKFNQPGAWLVEGVPADSDAAQFMLRGCGVLVERDNAVFLSGPATRIRRYSKDAVDLVDLSGVTDLAFLAVDAHPSPADLNEATQAYDVRTGVAETIMKAYVNANVGSTAHSSRKVSGLTTSVDTLLGLSIQGRARFQPLLDLLTGLALAAGDLGFTVTQAAGSTALVFGVYRPVDLTNNVVFAVDLGTLASYDYELRAPTGNVVTVAGGGEGVARTFVKGGDSASISAWGRRIETFVDRRDTVDLTELGQSRDENLAEQAEQQTIEVIPVDTSAFAFVDNYNLGDTVTATVDGVDLELVVREAAITIVAGEAEIVAPRLATPAAIPAGFDLTTDRIRRQERRIRNLERR